MQPHAQDRCDGVLWVRGCQTGIPRVAHVTSQLTGPGQLQVPAFALLNWSVSGTLEPARTALENELTGSGDAPCRGQTAKPLWKSDDDRNRRIQIDGLYVEDWSIATVNHLLRFYIISPKNDFYLSGPKSISKFSLATIVNACPAHITLKNTGKKRLDSFGWFQRPL